MKNYDFSWTKFESLWPSALEASCDKSEQAQTPSPPAVGASFWRSPSRCSEWWMPAWVQLQLLGLVSESTEAPKRPSTSITDDNLLRQTIDFIQIHRSTGRQFSILFPNEGGFTVVAVGEIQRGQISGP